MDEYRRSKRSFSHWGPEHTEYWALPEENRAWNPLGAGQSLPRRRSFFDPEGFRAVGLVPESGAASGTSGSPIRNVSSIAYRGQSGGPLTQQIGRAVGEFLSDAPSLLGGSRDTRGAGSPGRFRAQDGSTFTREKDGGITAPINGVTVPIDDKIHLPDGLYYTRDNGKIGIPHVKPDPGIVISEHIAPQLAKAGRIFFSVTGRELEATSAIRTPHKQAELMYGKFLNRDQGIYSNKRALAPIYSAYAKGRKDGLRSEDIISSMADIISGQVSKGIFVSAHLDNRGLDLRKSNIPKQDWPEIRKAIVQAGGTVLNEGDHFHIQFPRTKPNRP